MATTPKEKDTNKISYILGNDMLIPKAKDEFLNTMETISNDKNILDDWLLEALARDKVKCQIEYARDKAIREGHIQGFAQGIEEGTRQGIRQGSENSRLEMIKNMLNVGISYDVISKVTGKPVDEIKRLDYSTK